MGATFSVLAEEPSVSEVEETLLRNFPEFFINDNRKLARILASIAEFFVTPKLYMPILEQIEFHLKQLTKVSVAEISTATMQRITINHRLWPFLTSKPIKPSYYWFLEHFLSKVEQEEHFNQNPEYQHIAPTLLGMLPYNIADQLLADGMLWNDDKLYGRQFLHGQKSHRIQIALLALAIKSQVIDTEGFSIKDIIQRILDIKFKEVRVGWDLFFDFDCSKTVFKSLRGKDTLGDPYFLNYFLITASDTLPFLSSIVQYQFHKTLFDVQKTLQMQGEDYSIEDILLHISQHEKTPLPANNDISVEFILKYYEQAKKGKFDQKCRQIFFKDKKERDVEGTVTPPTFSP